MLKLILVVAAIMLHVVASQPLEINVEVTVNGVKIPISQNQPKRNSGSSFGTRAGTFIPVSPIWAGKAGRGLGMTLEAKIPGFNAPQV